MQSLKPAGKAVGLLAIILAIGIPLVHLIVDHGGPLFVIMAMAGPWTITGCVAVFSMFAAAASEQYAKHASIMFNIAVCAFGLAIVSIVGAVELWYAMQ